MTSGGILWWQICFKAYSLQRPYSTHALLYNTDDARKTYESPIWQPPGIFILFYTHTQKNSKEQSKKTKTKRYFCKKLSEKKHMSISVANCLPVVPKYPNTCPFPIFFVSNLALNGKKQGGKSLQGHMQKIYFLYVSLLKELMKAEDIIELIFLFCFL